MTTNPLADLIILITSEDFELTNHNIVGSLSISVIMKVFYIFAVLLQVVQDALKIFPTWKYYILPNT